MNINDLKRAKDNRIPVSINEVLVPGDRLIIKRIVSKMDGTYNERIDLQRSDNDHFRILKASRKRVQRRSVLGQRVPMVSGIVTREITANTVTNINRLDILNRLYNDHLGSGIVNE